METGQTQPWWRRLFGWINKQYEIPVREIQATTEQTYPRMCPYCGSQEAPLDESLSVPYPVWKCQCGALGSGEQLPDLDDIADHLLRVLKIKATVSEPLLATDHPMISIQRYDVEKTERELPEILQRHGYEFRAVNVSPRCRMYWVKAKDKIGA